MNNHVDLHSNDLINHLVIHPLGLIILIQRLHHIALTIASHNSVLSSETHTKLM